MTTDRLRRELARAGAVADQTPEAVRPWPAEPQPSAPEARRGKPLARVGGAGGVTPIELDEYDMAMLAVDADRAVTVALIALDYAGFIECGEKLVHRLAVSGSLDLDRMRTTKPKNLGVTLLRPVRPPPGPAHPLEIAVYGAIVTVGASSGNLIPIRTASTSWPEVAAIEQRLVGAGLLRSEATRGRFQARRTLAGSKILLRATKIDHRLPWQAGGRRAHLPPAEVPLLVALHGDHILWDIDPALAFALDLTHPTDLRSCGCGACE
jgi:uncharacterized protein (TIGR04222 family)